MTSILESSESVRLYNFWSDVDDSVNTLHEELMGQNRVAVIEANPVTEQQWFYEFRTVGIARSFVAGMSECTDDPTDSQFFIVGADVIA